MSTMSATGTSEEIHGFDPDYAGRRAECDGGAFITGTHLAGR